MTAPWTAAEEGRPSGLVQVLKTPDGGIQPQAVVDAAGTVHVVFFTGDPAAGDLSYARRDAGAGEFSARTRVNRHPGSAVALGTIRGAQVALGRGGRVHVAWNGSGKALPKNAFGSNPMLYTRSDARGRGFEPERNLMTRTSGLDGGGSIAADDAGQVYVAWHGREADAPPGEMGRRMWVARSDDDGAHFAAEAPAFHTPTGACACCGTRALADHHGTVYVLYRAATNNVGRDLYLLTSRDRGGHFRGERLHPWTVNACPMSSASLAEYPRGVLASWETEQQVYFARIDPETAAVAPPVTPAGGRGRKHPAIAGNTRGEVILVWAEGTGWQRGGALAWQVFDPSGHPTDARGRIENGIPTWGLPTVVARPDGRFIIVH